MAISESQGSSAVSALKLRGLLWFYSNRNILGTALACLGPALLFLGVIREGWLWITVGLYAAGALAAPSPLQVERRIADTLSLDQLLSRLDALVAQVRPILTTSTLSHLDGIRDIVHDVLPRLVGLVDDTGMQAQYFIVRETVVRYLPETLSNYAALPPTFRVAHPLHEGKTARQLLDEQLALLEAQLNEVAVNVANGNAQALMSNGRFLKDRFAAADFQVN